MNAEGWKGDEFWVDLVENALYPPEFETKKAGIKLLLEGEDLAGKQVLDHGCGTGVVGRVAKEHGGLVKGIDISERLLKEAEQYFDVVQGDVSKLPFEDNSFDYVLSFLVLHIFEDIETPISEIARVMKSGGKLLLGIVHPFSEKWDLDTKSPFSDHTTYHIVEERTWLFNLTNGEHATATYFHRPFENWLTALLKHFALEGLHEPQLAEQHLHTGKYATTEYLFGKFVKSSF